MAQTGNLGGALMKASRPYKIIIQRTVAPVDDGYTTQPGGWGEYAAEFARIIWGTGKEQREAAQEAGSQIASFEVLSNSKTRALSITDRVCYPVTDPDPDKWPAWDIQAIADLGFNEGLRITCARAAA
jgi:hypothetical protein